MNIHTPTRHVIKMDYYGQPYEATILGREELDYKQLWDKWRESKVWDYTGSLPTKQINTYHQIMEEPEL